MFRSAAQGRAAPWLALLSLLLLAGGCRKPDRWEFYLADAAENRLGTALAAGQKARAVYRPDEPTTDQIGFQLFFRNEAGDWRVISLVIEKPETPAPFVATDLHAEELPPNSYLVTLIRNDQELSKLAFTIAPSAGTDQPTAGRSTAAAGASPALPSAAPPPTNGGGAGAARKAMSPPKSAFEEFVAPAAAPTPASAAERPLDPEAMPTPESNLEPTPEISAETGPRPTPEPEPLGPEAWDLATGTEILVFSAEDKYWHPASIVRAYQKVFTVRYFNPELPEADLEREKFRVRSLAEGMEVKIREGGELIDGVIVHRQGRNFSVALKADGGVRDVAGGKIVVASP